MENVNPFVPATPNGLRARMSQKLNELHAISAYIDSHLKNIDHTQIIIPPLVLFEQLLNDFRNPPDVLEMDDLESDNKSVDTPFISPFIDSDDESDDGEVLNELNGYGNAGNFYHNRIINSIDGDDLAFLYMIGFKKFVAYFDLFLPMIIITCMAYNTIMVEGLESARRNTGAIIRDVYVFVGSFTYVTDFDRGRKSSKTWETAKYGKIWYDEDVHDLRSFETKFPAIVFNDNLTLNETLSCEPTVSSLNDNKIDFRISFDESDDEDYTIVFDKNSFSYKIISTNDLKTDSESHNMPLFASPEPSVSCIDNLDFFKEFENEFPVIVYNDALTSKSNFSTEPTLCHQLIDKFDLKDETSLSECDEEEQNILYFNDIFSFNIIYHDDSKSDSDNDNDKIDIEQSSGNLSVKPLPDVINTDVGAYAQGLNKLLETRISDDEEYAKDDGSQSGDKVTTDNDVERVLTISNNVYFIASFIPYCCSDNQYVVSIKEDTAYLCLHSPKTTKETRSNTPYPEEGNTPYSSYMEIFWKISNVVPTPRNPRYAISKTLDTPITSITVNGKNAYELKGKFLDDLHKNAFNGTNGEDAVEHIEYFLKIVDPFDLPNTMDIFTKGALWDYWKLGSDEIKPTNDETSDLVETNHDDEQEIVVYIVGNTLCYQDLEWYDALKDSKVKEEALKNKVIMEGMIDDNDESSNNGWRRWDGYEIANHYQEEREYENEHEDEERCELFDDHELPVCTSRRFEMIKYSFGQDEEYVAIKEDEYEDLTNTSK
ncbi:hypothetical protein Tco_0905636 [Tanacetum coccineum]